MIQTMSHSSTNDSSTMEPRTSASSDSTLRGVQEKARSSSLSRKSSAQTLNEKPVEDIPSSKPGTLINKPSKASSSSPRSSITLDDTLVLPEQRGRNDKTRELRHVFFSVYRKMFAAIFIINLTAFIVFVALNNGSPTLANVKNAVSANLLASIMMRQELCVNALFDIATSVPISTPFCIRRKLAKVYHYGGVHSGCGTAAVVWFLLYTVLTTKDFAEHPTHGLAVGNVLTCYVLILMFLGILVGAHPKIRVRYHDYFERVHRFAGWTAFLTLWAQTFIVSAQTSQNSNINIGIVLVKNPGFWFLLMSTFFIALSWGRLRHRDVRAEVLSSHATRLHFTYKDMPPLYGLKVSSSPLLEWHAFATIPEPDGKGFSFIVSNAGDWTNNAITNAPPKLYTRGFPVHGPLYGARLFSKIVLVATGSGIGPCLSLLVDHKNPIPARVLWSTRRPESTYGKGVIDEVLNADPNAVIWDTTEKGYPDIVMETYKLYVESGAEAVYIVSNPKVTKKVVFGMESRGIAAFGPIFDS